MDFCGLTAVRVPFAGGNGSFVAFLRGFGAVCCCVCIYGTCSCCHGFTQLSSGADDSGIVALHDSAGKDVDEALQLWFSKAGELEAYISSSRIGLPCGNGGESAGILAAQVTFADHASATRALNLRMKSSDTAPSNRWIEAHKSSIVNPRDLQEDVDRFMASFETQEEDDAARLKALEGVPDEDGFITVTRRGGEKAIESKNVKKKRKLASAGDVGGGGLQLGPFYKFQIRETKRNRTNVPPCCVR